MSDDLKAAQAAVVQSGLSLIRLSPTTADEVFSRMIRAAWASVDGDEGADRLTAAQRRDETFKRIATLVCARHAVSIEAVQRRHPARGKPHVVSARMHLAHELRKTGLFTWEQIGWKLGVSHTVAMYYAERYQEGPSAVTDEQAIEAGAMVKTGMSLRQAAESLGVSYPKLRGRISWMKEQGRWTK